MDAKNAPQGVIIGREFTVQIKTPQESKSDWDYYKVLVTIPADQAFRPLSESECPLVKK